MANRGVVGPGPPRAIRCVWQGSVTGEDTHRLREALLDLLDGGAADEVVLDVRRVTRVDRRGLGVLIGANHLAAALGRRLTVLDTNGPVTAALLRGHVLRDFRVVQVPPGSS